MSPYNAPGILLGTDSIRWNKNKHGAFFINPVDQWRRHRYSLKDHTNTCKVATAISATKEICDVMRVHIQGKIDTDSKASLMT